MTRAALPGWLQGCWRRAWIEFADGTRNDVLYNAVAPVTLDGPIRVTTEGGHAQITSAFSTTQPVVQFAGITATATDGAAADPTQPSAVTGQNIVLRGQGFTSSTLVQFSGLDAAGASGSLTRTGSASGDGTTLTVAVPADRKSTRLNSSH